MNWFPGLCFCCVRWISNSVHLPDGQTGVKTLLLNEGWLRSGERWPSSSSNAPRCARTRSRNSEATSTGYGLAGEDFQNTGTLIVVRSSVFALSSAHSSPLARDAYNALWDSCPRSQERKSSPDSKSARRGSVVFKRSNLPVSHSGGRTFSGSQAKTERSEVMPVNNSRSICNARISPSPCVPSLFDPYS